MPSRVLVSKKIADILGVLAHPQRIRLIEELARGPKDVRGIEKTMELPQSTVSQHLSLLKSHGLVEGTRDGKSVIYSLKRPWLANWLLEAVRFIEEDSFSSNELKVAAIKAKRIWKL